MHIDKERLSRGLSGGNMKRIIMAAMIVSLAACGGDKDDVATEQQQEWESQKQSLVYSFPDDNQQQVPVPSPVVLRFSSPVMETSPAVVLREVGGPVVSDFEMEWVDGKRGLIITPDSKLKPMTDYVVQVPAIELEKGVAPAKNIRFSTRALFEGPKSLVASDTFEVTRMIPDGENYQVMDFSSFRVQFSQPLDQTTVKYGDSADATVQLTGPEGVVDAHLLVSGHYMTVDPKEDLTPGVEYSLNMTTGITSTYGETLPGGSFGNPGDTLAVSVKVSPQDTKAPGTGLRVSMVQDVADTGELSPLTGQPINLVPMASVLLGEDTATQASGTISAELAFVPNFPDATPFRVKRGSLIEGASIEVLIGGEVPAGFESGKVRMDFLSDATGYLLPNPYSNSDEAPRQVRLFMDVAVSTETPSANGAITQDLLHIELVGTSIVEDGVMVINAVGVVEPDVLGSERAKGILSFYMKAFEDQDRAPQPTNDSSPLTVQSWTPTGDNEERIKLDDPIVVNFNSPISIENKNEIKLYKNGEIIEVNVTVDGAAMVVRPIQGLDYSEDEDATIYRLAFGDSVKSINGGGYDGEDEIEFEMPGMVTQGDWYPYGQAEPNLAATPVPYSVPLRSAIVLSLYPGYPCVIDESTIDLVSGTSGKCLGSAAGVYEGDGDRIFPEDDAIPLSTIHSNFPIVIQFSKELRKDSVVLGSTLKVEEINVDNEYVRSINGRVDVESKRITFWPESPWENGSYYRYTISSNGNRNSESAVCDGSQSVCDKDNFPIQTQLYVVLKEPSRPCAPGNPCDRDWRVYHSPSMERGGGLDMTQYFQGGESSANVMQALVAPSYDVNANFIHEKAENITDSVNGALATTSGNASLGVKHIEYAKEEKGAEDQPLDPYACTDPLEPCYDPDGVIPPPNSAKILSRKADDPEDQLASVPVVGATIGCGYSHVEPYPGLPVGVGFPLTCPKQKFTYLNSSLITEVTDEYVPGKGLKVLIHPGQISGTSINVRSRIFSGQFVMRIDSGPQMMRMRYAKNDPLCEDSGLEKCARSKPIEAWITYGDSGPALDAEVDLYIDAPELVSGFQNGPGLIFGSHELVSFPVSMHLTGRISFSEDGRMIIEQYNINDVDLQFDVIQDGYAFTIMDLFIPAYGSRLEYLSDVIKK
ncbi:Ig-like domain-containing protein [Alcanivorax sp. S71-1-4]|uniref:Ig-like domain-containing protein n=1 Tax=Alcanivorax sp. S71-1-4 TaxID=1177159 RepID=UPI00135BE03C|nr:Ig-like domain-containing protein [Alcanivorax sp. S71-1-4]